jgi:hypothetical protein
MQRSTNPDPATIPWHAESPYACECGCVWPVTPYDQRPCSDCHEPRPPATWS